MLSSCRFICYLCSNLTDCNPGYYGGGCGETCSEHCAGDQDFCDHVNGTCDLGCDPGYQGYYCIQGEYQHTYRGEISIAK